MEATINEIESLLKQNKLDVAEAALQDVLKNHPGSAKAHFVEAQLLQLQGKKKEALQELATAEKLDPMLNGVPAMAIADLRVKLGAHTVTPATIQIIEPPKEESHWFAWTIGISIVGIACFLWYTSWRKKEQARKDAELAEQIKKRNEEATKKFSQFKPKEPWQSALRSSNGGAASKPAEARQPTAEPTVAAPPPQQPQTVVVQQPSSSNDMLTGVLIGNMLSGHHDHTDTRVIHEKEIIHESSPSSQTPTSNYSTRSSDSSSSWDSPSSSSVSNSQSSSSSSWDSGSSSDSSSSWDSGSSSSSWD